VRVVVVLVLAGCGRLAFDAAGSDGAMNEDGACADPCALEPARIDDAFDRADGPIGAGWAATPGPFAIANGQLEVSGFGTALRTTGPVTGDLWAQITLSAPNPEQEYGLVVGARTGDPDADRFLIAYHPSIGNSHVHLSVVLNGTSLAVTSDSAEFPAGTRMRVIVRGGMVELYFDEVQLFSEAPMMWPYPDLAGHIGVFGSYDGFPAHLDDFGAGPCGCP
jgi:hypothetical protein